MLGTDDVIFSNRALCRSQYLKSSRRLKYWERHKARCENITSSVPNIDTLCVFLENVVNKVFHVLAFGSVVFTTLRFAVDVEFLHYFLFQGGGDSGVAFGIVFLEPPTKCAK